METYLKLTLAKLADAVDTDDIECLADQIETKLSETELSKLQKMLKTQVEEKRINSENNCRIRQLLTFMC